MYSEYIVEKQDVLKTGYGIHPKCIHPAAMLARSQQWQEFSRQKQKIKSKRSHKWGSSNIIPLAGA